MNNGRIVKIKEIYHQTTDFSSHIMNFVKDNFVSYERGKISFKYIIQYINILWVILKGMYIKKVNY